MPFHGNRALGLALAACLAACSFDPIDLDGRACPCAVGWSCVGGTCVEGDPDDGGTPPDQGPVDSGPDDGGPRIEDQGLDGGAEDTGPGDAGPVPSVCESSTALFCDGFEGGLVPPWSSVRETEGSTFVADGVRPFRGDRSGHGTTTMPLARAYVAAELGGVSAGTLHGRAWVYVPSSSPHEVMTFLLIGQNLPPDYPLAAVQIAAGGRSWTYVGVPHDRFATGGTALTFPLDRWVCTTLSIDIGSDTPRVLATVDGTVVTDEVLPGPLVAFADYGEVGVEYTNSTTTAAELFVDEVEFDTAPLPCE